MALIMSLTLQLQYYFDTCRSQLDLYNTTKFKVEFIVREAGRTVQELMIYLRQQVVSCIAYMGQNCQFPFL